MSRWFDTCIEMGFIAAGAMCVWEAGHIIWSLVAY